MGVIVACMIKIVVGILVGDVTATCVYGNMGTMGTKREMGLFLGTRVFLREQCTEQEGTEGNNGNKVLIVSPLLITHKAFRNIRRMLNEKLSFTFGASPIYQIVFLFIFLF